MEGLHRRHINLIWIELHVVTLRGKLVGLLKPHSKERNGLQNTQSACLLGATTAALSTIRVDGAANLEALVFLLRGNEIIKLQAVAQKCLKIETCLRANVNLNNLRSCRSC